MALPKGLEAKFAMANSFIMYSIFQENRQTALGNLGPSVAWSYNNYRSILQCQLGIMVGEFKPKDKGKKQLSIYCTLLLHHCCMCYSV